MTLPFEPITDYAPGAEPLWHREDRWWYLPKWLASTRVDAVVEPRGDQWEGVVYYRRRFTLPVVFGTMVTGTIQILGTKAFPNKFDAIDGVYELAEAMAEVCQ